MDTVILICNIYHTQTTITCECGSTVDLVLDKFIALTGRNEVGALLGKNINGTIEIMSGDDIVSTGHYILLGKALTKNTHNSN